MKLFTKLALVSAVAVSGSAMAMESMDDSALSSTTGQDGISIGIGISKVAIENLYIHDNDGLATGSTFAGVAAAKKQNAHDVAYNGVDQTAIAAAYLTGAPAQSTDAPAAGSAYALIFNKYQAATGATNAAANTYAAAYNTGLAAANYAGVTAATAYAGAQTDIIGGTGNAGAIIISGNSTAGSVNENDGIVITANTAALLASHNLADITIDTDGGTGTNGEDAFLNIGAKVSGLQIDVGNISVGRSNGQAVAATGTARGLAGTKQKNLILSGLSLTTGVMNANIQLGNTPQGAMIVLNGTMNKGLTISKLGIVDSAGDGQITIGELRITDANSANLSTNASVGVTKDGIRINAMRDASSMYIKGLNVTGTGSFATNTFVADTNKSIGDIEISNMRVFNGAAATAPGAIITIAGH